MKRAFKSILPVDKVLLMGLVTSLPVMLFTIISKKLLKYVPVSINEKQTQSAPKSCLKLIFSLSGATLGSGFIAIDARGVDSKYMPMKDIA